LILLKPNGIYVPNITPFNLSGEIMFDAFEELIEYWIKSGISGIVANASTGEAPYKQITVWRYMLAQAR
jgi:4-hydroxy-tetrahydrodipicolinate synthase